MRKPQPHAELIKTWDTATLVATIGSLEEHISDLKRDREDASKWVRRLAECEVELARR